MTHVKFEKILSPENLNPVHRRQYISSSELKVSFGMNDFIISSLVLSLSVSSLQRDYNKNKLNTLASQLSQHQYYFLSLTCFFLVFNRWTVFLLIFQNGNRQNSSPSHLPHLIVFVLLD